ncbi:hypothetical protein GCM10018987_20080 [Streptomyces cremeus]
MERPAARGQVRAVVPSPLRRWRQAARFAVERPGPEARIGEELREAEFEVREGLTYAEVQQRRPGEPAARLSSPTAAPPGGEPLAGVVRRVEAARNGLLARHPGETVPVVTHGAPVRQLVRLALSAPPEPLFRMEAAAASVSATAHYAHGNASAQSLDDTARLR